MHILIKYIFLQDREGLNKHGNHATANNSTDNNDMFFIVSDLKTV